MILVFALAAAVCLQAFVYANGLSGRGEKENIAASIPMGSMGTTEDVAKAAAFLASDGARYITGQVLRVDGGMAM